MSIGAPFCLCQASIFACISSRLAKSVRFFGARSCTMADKPFKYVSGSTPVPGNALSIRNW